MSGESWKRMRSSPWTERKNKPLRRVPSAPRERRPAMVIGLIVGIVFIAGVLYFQHRNKDQ